MVRSKMADVPLVVYIHIKHIHTDYNKIYIYILVYIYINNDIYMYILIHKTTVKIR